MNYSETFISKRIIGSQDKEPNKKKGEKKSKEKDKERKQS
jgi:hypothetical protein